MVGKHNRLLDLYERKEDVVLNMDGFQIVKNIENIVFDILTEIFYPYIVTKVFEKGFGHMPDYEVRFEYMESHRNRLFFEIKSGDLHLFDLRELEKIVRELSILYTEEFYSLIVIARSLKNKLEIEAFCKRVNLERIIFISAKTFVSIFDVLKEKLESREKEAKNLFLLSLLKQKGILSYEYISSYDFSQLMDLLSIKKMIISLNSELISLSELKESAEETLRFWREQHLKFIKKKELIKRRQEIYQELVWIKIAQNKKTLEEWEKLCHNIKEIRGNLHNEISRIEIREYSHEELNRYLKFLKAHDEQLKDLELTISKTYEEINTKFHLEKQEALKLGDEIVTKLTLADLEKEIKKIDIELANLVDVSNDAENMYESYKRTYKELENRTKKVEADKNEAQKLYQVKVQQ